MTIADAHYSADSVGLPQHLVELRSTVREFAMDRVRPTVLRNDQSAADDFDWDVVRAGHDIGLLRLVVPQEFGGLGYGVLGVAIALEEIAAV